MDNKTSPWIAFSEREPGKEDFPVEITDGRVRLFVVSNPITSDDCITHWRPLGNPPLPEIKKSLKAMDYQVASQTPDFTESLSSFHDGANYVREQVESWARDYFIGNVPLELNEIIGTEEQRKG